MPMPPSIPPSGNNVKYITRSDGYVAQTAGGIAINTNVAAVRSSPLRIATLSDSTGNFGSWSNNANNTDQSGITAALGTTTNAYVGNANKLALPLLYPAANVVANGGISGQTTTLILARELGASAVTRRSVQDVLDLNPDVIILRAGSINNLNTLTASAAQSVIDQAFADHVEILQRCRGNASLIIDEGIAGFDALNGVAPAAADLAFIRASLVALNARYAAYIKALSDPMVRWLEPSGLLHDGTGKFVAGMTNVGDGQHPTIKAQMLVAAAEAAIISSVFGASARVRFPGTNLLGSLAQFVTVVGGSYGNTPTGCAWVPTNCTITGTAGTLVHDGNIWAEATATAVAAGASLMFQPPMGIWSGAANPTVNIVAGSTYGFELDAYVQTIDGSNLPAAWYPDFRVNLQNNASGRYVIDLGNPTVYPDVDYGVSGYRIHCASPEWTATESSATLINSSQWFIKMVLPPGPAGYKMGVANPRLVKIR